MNKKISTVLRFPDMKSYAHQKDDEKEKDEDPIAKILREAKESKLQKNVDSKTASGKATSKNTNAPKNKPITYPEAPKAPSKGYFSYPDDKIQKDMKTFEDLYRADNDKFYSGVKDTVAPYYRKATEDHRKKQSPYPSKSYPGLTTTKPVTDLEKHIPFTEDYYNAYNKYATEVYPYGVRAGETAKAAAEYEKTAGNLYDEWRSRIRDPEEVQAEIDSIMKQSSTSGNGGRSGTFGAPALEEELEWARYFRKQETAGYTLQNWQGLIDNAIRQGNWKQANRYLTELTQAELPAAEREQAVAYIDKVTDENYLQQQMQGHWAKKDSQVSKEARDAKSEILLLADRGQWEDLFSLMHSEKGKEYKRLLLQEYGIDADSSESKEGNYFGLASQLQYGNLHDYNMLAESRETYKTQLATNSFRQRAQEEIQRAGKSHAHSAQMDSYVRAQSAYYILNSLSGLLGVEDAGVQYRVDGPTQYLIDYLASECGVDLSGMTEANHRSMIRSAMQEQSKKAIHMRDVLNAEGYDTDAVREYAELAIQTGFEENRIDAFADWSKNAGTGEKILTDILMIPYRTGIEPMTALSDLTALGGDHGDTNDPNSYIPVLGKQSPSDLVRSAASESIEQNTNWELFDRNVWSFLYNAGMSAADSAANAFSYGKFAILAMGTRAAGSEANDILARGGSREQAFRGGIAAGAIEAITEYVSVDKLLSDAGTVDSLKALFKSAASQAFTEGTEEMSSEILNIIVESANMGNLSRNSQAVEAYMDQGMSYDAARQKVLYDNIGKVVESGVSGFLSGGFSGGAKSATAYIDYRTQKKAIDLLGHVDENTDAYKICRALHTAGASMTEDNRLATMGELMWQGMSQEDAQQITNAVKKAVNGKQLTSQEKTLLQKDPLIGKVLRSNLQRTNPDTQTAPSAPVKTELEQRADMIQASNPNATVIRSSTVQAYIDTGKVTLKNAQKAASVLEAIVSGEKTTLSSAEIDSLMLITKAGSQVASQVLGIEIPQYSEKATARTQFRAAIEQYATTRSQEQNNTPVAQDYFAEEFTPTDSVTATDDVGIDPAKAHDIPTAVRSPEITNSEYSGETYAPNQNIELNQNEEANPQNESGYPSLPASNRMSYVDFASEYRRNNKNANVNDIAMAYGGYLASVQNGNTVNAPRNIGNSYGIQNREAYQGVLDNDILDRIDAVGKLFDLKVTLSDLGDTNGLYEPGTGNVTLDIAPVKEGTVDPFLFTISHELGHAIRDRIGAKGWASFESYAVKIMGGETAIRNKQGEHSDYNASDMAREDLACDFIGKLLSDKSTLDTFCNAVRSGSFNARQAKGIGGLIRRFLNKIIGKYRSVQNELAKGIQTRFGADLETAMAAANEILKAADAALKAKENTAENVGSVKKSFKGYDLETGRGIYESNFPKGTPKSAKAAVILDYIQNVWSKKPISLIITNPDGTTREIKAEFDPTYDPNPHVRTDASKLMGGNRHGTASDQRVTLDLASDYYQILSESVYNYSKDETGKQSAPHENVKQWHYFVNDILFVEYGEKEARPYGVTINVKEKENGTFVYSFSAELQKNEGMNTRQTLHADVTPTGNSGGNVHSHNDKLAENLKKVNTPKEKKSVKELDADYIAAVESGDMETAQRMVDKAAEQAGYTIHAYHGTTNRQEKATWNANKRMWDTEYSRITVFKRQYPEQAGHFFNSDRDNAGGYGSDLFSVYLMLKKPLVIDCKGQNYASITHDGKEMDTYEWAEYARKYRYDGVVFENISDGVDYDALSRLTTDYVVFDSNRIKSADPVTYDDNGNVIPLSERFNEKKPDIRYSKKDRASEVASDSKVGRVQHRSADSNIITQSDIQKLRSIERKSVNEFTSKEIQLTEKWARRFYREIGIKSPFFRAWFGDWRIHDKNSPAIVTQIPATGKINTSTRTVKNEDTKWSIKIDNSVFNDSIHYAGKDKPYLERLLSKIDVILNKAILLDTAVSGKKSNNKKGSTQFMHYLYAAVEYNGNPFMAKIAVEEYEMDGKHRAYNVERIKMSTLSRAQYSQMKSAYRGSFASSADAISVADLAVLVKEFDKKYSPKSVNQVLLNDDGTPKVFYHGIGEKFTTFSPDEMSSEEGSYFFAENEEDASAYGKYVMPVYLSAENLANYDNQPAEFYRLRNKRAQVEWLKKRGYDGWYADMDSGGWGEVSVFSQGQIKSATDNIGTFDRQNPDIRYSKKDKVPGTDTYAEQYGTEIQSDTQLERAMERSEARAEQQQQYNTAGDTAKKAQDALTDGMEQEQKSKQKKWEEVLFAPTKKTSERELYELTPEQLRERLAATEKKVVETQKLNRLLAMQKQNAQAQMKETKGVKLDTTGMYSFVQGLIKSHGKQSATASYVRENTDALIDIFNKSAEYVDTVDFDSGATYLYAKGREFATEIAGAGNDIAIDTMLHEIMQQAVKVNQKPRGKTRMDTLIAKHKAHLEEVKTKAREAQAKSVADAEKRAKADQSRRDTKEAIRIVEWYENEIEKIEAKYRKRIETEKRRGARKEHKAAMESALIAEDKASKAAAKAEKQHQADMDKLTRKAQRKIRSLEKEKEREIARLEKRAAVLALRNTPEGASAADVISEFRRRRNPKYADRKEDISTSIVSAEEMTKKQKAKKDGALRRLTDGVRRAFVTDILDIERFSKLQNRPDTADVRATMYRNRGATIEMIQQDCMLSPSGDIIDERSLASVAVCWQKDKVGGKVDQERQDLFQQYLFHKHGYDRMSVKSRAEIALKVFMDMNPEYDVANEKHLTTNEILALQAKGDSTALRYIELCKQYSAAKNKPVMGDEDGHAVSASLHMSIAYDIEREAPWVAEKAIQLYEWWDKFMQAWVVGSELSQEQYDDMKKMYPHYVPTYRAFEKNDKGVFVTGKDGMTVKKSIRVAKGSTMDLMNVDDSLAVQVAKIVEHFRFNELAMNIIDEVLVEENLDPEMADYAVYSPYLNSNIDFRAMDMDNVSEEIEGSTGRIEKSGQSVKLTAWHNGQPISVNISVGMARSLEALAGKHDRLDKLAKVGSILTTPMKTAITGINPFFAARNIPRDQALAMVNSVAGPHKFPLWTVRAINHMRKKSPQWKQFVALGGTGSSHYNAEHGFANSLEGDGIGKKVLNVAGAFNEATESMTRFAEYLATIDKHGDTAEGRAVAIKNAAEITVDFSRHGEYGKVLNAWIPYWNPAIQGMSRLMRSVFNNDGVKGAAKTLGKATLVSVLPEALLMALLFKFGGYDDWEEFDDRSKDAYYLIPIGDGKAIKIAKGREWAQLIGNPLMRAWQGLNGREDPFENYWDTSIAPNFMPSTPLDAIGISQSIDLLTNKDFAGRTIVPNELQGIDPKEQYDENTSIIAKAIGKVLNLSPIQIDYIIGDYFGDFGDILIECTNGSNTNTVDYVKDLFTSPFVADSAYSNHVNTEYYDLIDALEGEINTMKVRDGDSYKESDRYQIYQAINKFKNRISDLNKKARESEDAEASRLLKLDVRAVQQEALDFYEAYMNGEIADPVRHLEYEPYGDAVREELIRLKEYEDGDYTFLPSSSAPKIGDHKNTDAEKDSYKEIYEGYYTREIGNVISSDQYKNASDEKKLSMLENSRELAYFYAKQEWASKHSIKADSYDPETATDKYDTLIDTGLSFFDAYAIEEQYQMIRDSANYGTQTLRATAYAAWVDSHDQWSDEQKAAAKSAYKFTQTMIVDPKKYDALSELSLNAKTSETIVSVVAGVKPNAGAKTVSDLQKWQAIVRSNELTDSDKDKGLRAYMDSEALAKYDPCSRAGVTASEYIETMTQISKLAPLPGKDGVSSFQKWEICVSSVTEEKKQDALIRNYMTGDQLLKYDTCRSVNISPDIYVKCSAAKYTYGNGNGSWTQDELESWLDSQDLTKKQKSVLWTVTNSGWKNNPYS